MAKEKNYEYHKQNDYPGERIAERKRVAEREEEAERKADARVAAKGRSEGLKADNRVAARGRRDDALMDSEIERSTNRATKINRKRDAADSIGLAVIAGLIIILLVGSVWGFMAIQRQSNEISDLKTELAVTPAARDMELSSANKQIQLYNDYLVLTADVKKEVNDLNNYESRYSNIYQLCSDYVNRLNNVNLAMSRFAEKEIIYYRQIAILADKPECTAKISTLNEAMENSKMANENYYVQHMNQCDRLLIQTGEDNMQWETNLKNALDESIDRAEAYTDAQKDAIACIA